MMMKMTALDLNRPNQRNDEKSTLKIDAAN